MKKLVITFVFSIICAVGLSAQSEAVTNFFDKYSDDERFSTVYISPAMFEMVADMEPEEMDAKSKDILSSLQGIRILSGEDLDGTAFFREATTEINTDQYETFMEVRDGQENVKFLTRREDDSVEEILMLVGEPDEFTMISFIGSISPDDLSTLGKTFDLDMGDLNRNKGDEIQEEK